jgi:hypothetical protein
MPTNPQAAQTEQTFLALVERLNAQFIPDLNAKLNDHTVDHVAAIDAALAQTHAVENELGSIQATANQLGADPGGALAQRVFEVSSAVRRARATLEGEREAATAAKPVAPAAPSYPTTAEDVLKQLRSSTEPGQQLFNIESAAIDARRKAIDDTTARILASFKHY